MQPTDVIADFSFVVLFLAVLTLLVKPFGEYLARVFEGEKNVLTRVVEPFEKRLYRLLRTSPAEEMTWQNYAKALLAFNAIGFLALLGTLLFQQSLPLNPQHFPSFTWDSALNTAVSFVTNTDWQVYSGEAAASYFTQMTGLALQNFLSAATGLCILIALIRGFARKNTDRIGNFWVDATRGILYVFLPLCLIFSVFLVSQGVIQNFSPYVTASVVQPFSVTDALTNTTSLVTTQTLPMGPIASQESIKELGTNGGGPFNANSAHPFENPTPLSNSLETLAILLIPAALTYTFGRMVGDKKQGWALYAAMLLLFTAAVGSLYLAESAGNPLVSKLGVVGANMEGKEVRFGVAASALFAVATTGTSTGAVNAMHDSFTPLGGLVPLVLISLGEVVFGGVGSGLYTMLAFAVLAVFIAGLMIGRIPEYLGKKIEPREMWASVAIVLVPGAAVLIFASIALVTDWGVSSILNPGAHGLTEIFYAFLSMSNNNGSAFAGLNANTLFYNLAGALAMLVGRFVPAIAALAMAGSLAQKKYTPPSPGSLPTHRLSFVVWLIFVIVIVGALSFFAAFAAGPIVEHLLLMRA